MKLKAWLILTKSNDTQSNFRNPVAKSILNIREHVREKLDRSLAFNPPIMFITNSAGRPEKRSTDRCKEFELFY